MRKEDLFLVLLAGALLLAMLATWYFRDNSRSLHGHGDTWPAADPFHSLCS
ncbi:MAG: hypothetical protein AB1568_09145 [Thermodesulfobacteriota bacterium]